MPDDVRACLRPSVQRGDELLQQEFERHLAGGGRPPVDGPADQTAYRLRETAVPSGGLVAEVGGIAAEQLIRAFPGEDDLDLFAGRLGQEIRRQDGGIADRLGEDLADDVRSEE